MLLLPVLFLLYGGLFFVVFFILSRFQNFLSAFLGSEIYVPSPALLSFLFALLAGIFGVSWRMVCTNGLPKITLLVLSLSSMVGHVYFLMESMVVWNVSFKREVSLLLSGDLFASVVFSYFMFDKLFEMIKSVRRGERAGSGSDARR